MQTNPLTQDELELALVWARQRLARENLFEQLLPLPNNLKHLTPMDWELMENLLVTLEYEKATSPLQ